MKKYGITAVYGSRLFPVCPTNKKGFCGYKIGMNYTDWFQIVKTGHKESAENRLKHIQDNCVKGFNPTLRNLDLKVIELEGKDLKDAVKRVFGDSK